MKLAIFGEYICVHGVIFSTIREYVAENCYTCTLYGDACLKYFIFFHN